MTTSRRDKAGGVADVELLRLARKAWPDESRLAVENVDDCCVAIADGYGVDQALIQYHDRAREALHAALAVLAGEVDLQALLDARRGIR